MSVPMDCPGFGRLVGDAAALIGDVPEPGDRAHPSPGFGNPLPGIGARGNGRLDYRVGDFKTAPMRSSDGTQATSKWNGNGTGATATVPAAIRYWHTRDNFRQNTASNRKKRQCSATIRHTPMASRRTG